MNRPEELLNELKINRRGPQAAKKRRWPWILGALLVAVVAFLLLRGGKGVIQPLFRCEAEGTLVEIPEIALGK